MEYVKKNMCDNSNVYKFDYFKSEADSATKSK